MEKLNEIKETYAKELGYKDWETCINDQPNYKVETLMDEVALRYGFGSSLTSKEAIDHEICAKRKDKEENLKNWAVALFFGTAFIVVLVLLIGWLGS